MRPTRNNGRLSDSPKPVQSMCLPGVAAKCLACSKATGRAAFPSDVVGVATATPASDMGFGTSAPSKGRGAFGQLDSHSNVRGFTSLVEVKQEPRCRP